MNSYKNKNKQKNDKDNSLTSSTTNSEVARQLLRNAAEGRTNDLVDTLLPKNRQILRAYQVKARDPFTNNPTSIRIWDLFFDAHEVDKRLEKFFEQQHPEYSIIVFDRAANDRVYKLDPKHKFTWDYVITLAGLYYQDVERVKPGLLQELNPVNDPGFGTPISLIGEIPADQNPPTHAMLSKANFVGITHPKPEELPDNRFCSAYNCPICKPLDYTIQKVIELGFLNPTVTVWLSESIHSRRHQEYDELSYIAELLETTNLLTQTSAVMADAAIVQTADKQTLERMKKDYEELLKVLK